MIFDNVEDLTRIEDAMPLTGTGRVLVTCRSEYSADFLASAPPTLHVLEVPTFTREEGGELLLQIAGQVNPSAEDRSCALELSERLGGLALALDLIGRQIKIRKKTMTPFLPFYLEHRLLLNKQPSRGIRNKYYSLDLETVWKTSFLNLSDDAASLIRLMCFVAPDDIPDFLFTGGDHFPAKYAFISNPARSDFLRTWTWTVQQAYCIQVGGCQDRVN